MSENEPHIHVEGKFGSNINIGSNNTINTGNQVQASLSLTPDDAQAIRELARVARELLASPELDNNDETQLLAGAQVLEAQAESLTKAVPGVRKAIDRIGQVLRRLPEQALASTAGSLGAAAVLDQVSRLPFP